MQALTFPFHAKLFRGLLRVFFIYARFNTNPNYYDASKKTSRYKRPIIKDFIKSNLLILSKNTSFTKHFAFFSRLIVV